MKYLLVMLMISIIWALKDDSLDLHFPVPQYEWDEVTVHQPADPKRIYRTPASLVAHGLPVYVSITTMDSRIHQVNKTILQIMHGPVVPDRLFLFISKEKYILDKGIPRSKLPPSLLDIAANYPVSIVYTKNIGPHRKLLPLLAKKWKEDCVIITLDDESKAGLENYVQYLISYFLATKKRSVIGLKVRRIGLCEQHPWKPLKYLQWGEIKFGHTELFALPTGTGGILYRPRFFHPVVFSEALRKVTSKADDLTFRLATLINRVPVTGGCRDYIAKKNNTYVRKFRCPRTPRVSNKIPTNMSTNIYELEAATLTAVAATTSSSPRGAATTSSSPRGAARRSSRRRRLGVSLFGEFNRFDGNNVAWAAATKLLANMGLLDLPALADTFIPLERSYCFHDTNGGKKPPKACMLKACKVKDDGDKDKEVDPGDEEGEEGEEELDIADLLRKKSPIDFAPSKAGD